jgi:hypothetical protein
MNKPTNTAKQLWDDASDQALRRLIAEGCSYTLVANRLGRTRNSVAGRVARLQIQTPNRPSYPTVRPTTVRPTSAPHTADTALPATTPANKYAAHRAITGDELMEDIVENHTVERVGPLDFPETKIVGVPFLQIRSSQCHAPLDERDEDGLITYCGAPVRKPGESYCKPCRDKFFIKPVRHATNRGDKNASTTR